MKKNWGNNKTKPNYEFLDQVYSCMQESCMILDNNKKISWEVRQEMNKNYKDRLGSMMRENKSHIWVQQRMPQVKKVLNVKSKADAMREENEQANLMEKQAEKMREEEEK